MIIYKNYEALDMKKYIFYLQLVQLSRCEKICVNV